LDLVVAGLLTELSREFADRVLYLVRLLPNLPRAPVLAAQLIENRPTDTQRGALAELFVRLTAAAQSFKPPHQPDLLHILAAEYLVGLQRQLPDDALDQRQVLHHPALLKRRREYRRRRWRGAVVVDGARSTHGAADYCTSSLLTSTCSKGTAAFLLAKSSNSTSSRRCCNSAICMPRSSSNGSADR